MVTTDELALVRPIDAARELKHIEALAAIGDRFIGTDGDRAAIDYIMGEFNALGLEIQETPIRVPTFLNTSEPVLKTVETGRTYDAISPYFSPSTPAGGLEAEVVPIIGGKDEDYEGVDVSGKIALLMEVDGGFSMFWLGTYAERAARHGAVGLIIIHPMPWPYRMTMEAGNSKIANRFCTDQLPAVCVSALDGAHLMYEVGRGNTRVHMVSETLIEDRDSVIISAFRRGTEFPDERVGVIGHRDNGIAPGANDNLSGSACMLELARLFAETESPRGFEFISSTAEEGVTIGAWSYCQQHKADLKANMKALFDVDMVGVGGRICQVERGLWPDCDPILQPDWLMEMVDEIAGDLGFQFGRMTAGWGVAESARFLEIGVPATWLWAPDDPYYHTVEDSPDKINTLSLKGVSDVVAIAMWRIANGAGP